MHSLKLDIVACHSISISSASERRGIGDELMCLKKSNVLGTYLLEERISLSGFNILLQPIMGGIPLHSDVQKSTSKPSFSRCHVEDRTKNDFSVEMVDEILM